MTFRLERRLDATDLGENLRREARSGLTSKPKHMRSRWLWDERGSALYDQIMDLPDYYLPRAERALLRHHAGEIADLVRPRTVVELGSGSSVKSPILLHALPELEHYVAVDVDDHGPVLVFSLGSTLGGLEPEDCHRVLGAVARAIAPDGALLLGLDLVKPLERMLAAYDVEDEVTHELIANLLPVLNRELDANFEPWRFRSEAEWNPDLERMEMFVRALEPQTVTLRALDLTVDFAEGERLRTEISTKFRREGVERELAAVGLGIAEWWEDDAADFALCLARLANRA
jgi:L-histidine Nalpha-methyltransferase